MMIRSLIISFVFVVFLQGFTLAQDSVVGLVRNNLREGNRFFQDREYEKALQSYKLVSQHKLSYDARLKMARCYYFLKRYKNAAAIYAALQEQKPLPEQDLIYFAELNTSLGRHPEALDNYKHALTMKPGNPAILQRVWQLTNVHLFFEDSIHYRVRRLPFNSLHAELSPIPFRRGVLFLSDRTEIDFKNPGQEPGKNDFSLYYAGPAGDTTSSGLETKFRNPVNYGKNFPAPSGLGPVSFYAGNTKCVFAALGNKAAGGQENKMQLFFSENSNGRWTTPSGFEHNNAEFNLSDPSISADGTTLFFTSDAPGGFGGYDIYRSVLRDGRWTSPENLGDNVNTAYQEAFPFLYYNTLYFSSDGHPGLGGLDIFSTIISNTHIADTKNLGYPLNSGADDFGFVLQTPSRGFFTSNRLNEGYDDDIYQFEMDFRAYPFDIAGTIVMRERHAADTLHQSVMAGAAVELIDHARNVVIANTRTDDHGRFSVSIPYFSKYKLRILYPEAEEYIVSLEINRESSNNSDYAIVVIKHSSDVLQTEKIESE